MTVASHFLLNCLSSKREQVNIVKAAALSHADWESVIQLAGRSGMVPLLYHRLKTVYADITPPAPLMQKLQKAYLANSRRNTRFFSEFANVIRVLQEAGIQFMVLKGAHLAEVVYEQVALRPMSDIDILIKPADLSNVEKPLQALHYAPATGIWGNTGLVEKDLTYFKDLGAQLRLHIEVHWHLNPPRSVFQVDLDNLWERAQLARIAGTEVLVFSPEDLLLYLCVHSTYTHFFEHKLRPLYDISATLRYYSIDWKQLQARARQWRCCNCVYLTLRLADELLAAAVPITALNTIKPTRFDERLAIWAAEHILGVHNNLISTPVSSPPFNNLMDLEKVQILFFKFYDNRFKDRVINLLSQVFPSPRMMAQIYHLPYHSIRIYLYYPIRVKYLVIKLTTLASIYVRDIGQLLLRHDDHIIKLKKARTLMKWLELG